VTTLTDAHGSRQRPSAPSARPLVPGRRRTLVSAADPAFASPSKLVGPVYTERQARQLADAHGWDIGKDGPWWRRIVPSPEPLELLDLPLICTLEGTGAIVICAGGGGVPVVRNNSGRHHGHARNARCRAQRPFIVITTLLEDRAS